MGNNNKNMVQKTGMQYAGNFKTIDFVVGRNPKQITSVFIDGVEYSTSAISSYNEAHAFYRSIIDGMKAYVSSTTQKADKKSKKQDKTKQDQNTAKPSGETDSSDFFFQKCHADSDLRILIIDCVSLGHNIIDCIFKIADEQGMTREYLETFEGYTLENMYYINNKFIQEYTLKRLFNEYYDRRKKLFTDDIQSVEYKNKKHDFINKTFKKIAKYKA